MGRRRIFYGLSFLNIIVLLVVLFTDHERIGSILGIFLLITTFYIGLKIESDLSKIKKLILGKYVLEYMGLEALFFGAFGFYSMFKVTDEIDVSWFYLLIFNIFIISQSYVRINRSSRFEL